MAEQQTIDGARAAQEIQVPYSTVARWLARGKVPAQKIGRTYQVGPDGRQALKKLAESRRR
jgi:hypothetical protein